MRNRPKRAPARRRAARACAVARRRTPLRHAACWLASSAITSPPRRRRRPTSRRRRKSRRRRNRRRRTSRRRSPRRRRRHTPMATRMLPRPLAAAATRPTIKKTNRRKIRKGNGETASKQEALSSARNSGFFCHSAESVVSTVMMSSTPRVDAAVEIARLEAGRDGVGDDDLRGRVGQRALEPVADLDAHAMLFGRDQEQRAVVLLRLAELPGAEELVGVGLDLLAVERGDRRDDQLDARLRLELGELALEIGARAG